MNSVAKGLFTSPPLHCCELWRQVFLLCHCLLCSIPQLPNALWNGVFLKHHYCSCTAQQQWPPLPCAVHVSVLKASKFWWTCFTLGLFSAWSSAKSALWLWMASVKWLYKLMYYIIWCRFVLLHLTRPNLMQEHWSPMYLSNFLIPLHFILVLFLKGGRFAFVPDRT